MCEFHNPDQGVAVKANLAPQGQDSSFFLLPKRLSINSSENMLGRDT